MLNLQIIRSTRSRGGDYLGIASGFLLEVKDHDPALVRLLSERSDFKPLLTPAYRGRKRLCLLNYSETCLVIIKTGKAIAGKTCAKLYIYINHGPESDESVLALTRVLASYRWPSGVLVIAKSSLKKMPKDLPLALLKMGWIDLRQENDKLAFHLELPKPKPI